MFFGVEVDYNKLDPHICALFGAYISSVINVRPPELIIEHTKRLYSAVDRDIINERLNAYVYTEVKKVECTLEPAYLELFYSVKDMHECKIIANIDNFPTDRSSFLIKSGIMWIAESLISDEPIKIPTEFRQCT
jgi:hypothetical protein